MAISLLTSSADTSSGYTLTTTAINTTGANFILVVSHFNYNYGYETLTDSKSNTWSTETIPTDGNGAVQLFYCTPTSVGTSHTVSLANSRYYDVLVFAYSGLASSSPRSAYSSLVRGSYMAPGDTQQPGAITPTVDGCLCVAVGSSNSYYGSGTFPVGSPYTVISDGAVPALVVGTFTQGTAASVNPTWTNNTGVILALPVFCQAAFKPAAGGASIILPSRKVVQAVNRASTY